MNALLKQLHLARVARQAQATNDKKYEKIITIAKEQFVIRELPSFHIGSFVWDGSLLLNEYLHQNVNQFAGKIILELGAGTGLCSLVASRIAQAKKVIISDQAELVPVIQQQVAKNGILNATVLELDWFNAMQYESVPSGLQVIIAADIIYAKETFGVLLQLLQYLFTNNSNLCMYLSYKPRNKEVEREQFFDKLQQVSLVCTMVYSKPNVQHCIYAICSK